MNTCNPNENVLSVFHLNKKFGTFTAVDDVSFSIPKGVCFGLLGPNGAGKTTTIEMIEGILAQDAGEILYKGRKRGKNFFEEVGIQFQNTELPHFLTVKETLISFRNLYRKRMNLNELIQLCQLEDILAKDNRKISGGQKQRLLLAMAMANDPDLIFLDEPTTGLDPQARRHLWDIVFQLKKQCKSIVLTTHYMEEAQLLCDNIAIMDHGQFIAEGPPKDLLNEHLEGASLLLPETVCEDHLKGLDWPWFKLKDGTIEVQTHNINACMNDLIKRDVDLTGMTVRPRNLEDLFIKLTGRAIRS